MRQIVTTAIVLRRTNYGEADRILTLLTPDQGKLHLMAKGVRRVKSKLAGGIELFSVSEISYVKGRGEIGTLTSSRLKRHYAKIVRQLERTTLGYELIRQIHKVTEDEPESSYFELLEQALEALDDINVPLPVIQVWFGMRLLVVSGHRPRLDVDAQGQKLKPTEKYNFDFSRMLFDSDQSTGQFTASHIKFMRLGFGGCSPKVLAQVKGYAELLPAVAPAVNTMLTDHLVL